MTGVLVEPVRSLFKNQTTPWPKWKPACARPRPRYRSVKHLRTAKHTPIFDNKLAKRSDSTACGISLVRGGNLSLAWTEQKENVKQQTQERPPWNGD